MGDLDSGSILQRHFTDESWCNCLRHKSLARKVKFSWVRVAI